MIRVPESIYITNRVGDDPDPEPTDPVYELKLLDNSQTTAQVECKASVDCKMEYNNQQYDLVHDEISPIYFTSENVYIAGTPAPR